MSKKFFRFRDHKAEMFQDVWMSVNEATAFRNVQDLLRAGTMPRAYAADFSLWIVGEDDPLSGRVLPYDAPKHLIDVVELLEGIDEHGE